MPRVATRELFDVRGLAATSPAFKAELIRVADRLGADPNALAAVMSFETAATFAPDKRNPVSSATGLIQFMASTARALGTSTEELANMSAVAQLRYVEKYLQGARGKFSDVADHYMAVFAPVGLGKPPGFILYSDPKTVAANAGLDRLPKDAKISKQEAALPVQGLYNAAEKRARLLVDMSVTPGDETTPSNGGPKRTPKIRSGVRAVGRVLARSRAKHRALLRQRLANRPRAAGYAPVSDRQQRRRRVLAAACTLPNALTLIGYGLGLWWVAGGPAWSAVVSVVLDELDGRLARALGSCSSLGSKLDWTTDIVLTAMTLGKLGARPALIVGTTGVQTFLRDHEHRPRVGSARALLMLYGVMRRKGT